MNTYIPTSILTYPDQIWIFDKFGNQSTDRSLHCPSPSNLISILYYSSASENTAFLEWGQILKRLAALEAEKEKEMKEKKIKHASKKRPT